MSYFEDRKMIVKWHGVMSEAMEMKGGGPQGSTIGILEYLSQSNDNADCVPQENRFKFVDDLTTLEVIYLLNIGMASMNPKLAVSSSLPDHNQFIPSEHLQTQTYLKEIENWTSNNLMKLNPKKTKNMIFNFSINNQFTSNVTLQDEPVEIVSETKLLGTMIQSNLKWDKNTEAIIKGANKRMQMLHAARKFTSNIFDLKQIYTTFIRSKLEHSAVVWHSSLTQDNRTDLERVQKTAVKIIMGNKYKDYNHSLKYLKLDSLYERREKLSLKFAKKCLRTEKAESFFTINQNKFRNTRNFEKYKVKYANTKRFQNSSIIYMQKLLNLHEAERKKKLRTFGC